VVEAWQAFAGLQATETKARKMSNKQNKFPPRWDEERVRRVLAHYEQQSEEEAVAEDEAAFEDSTQTVMEIPNELVPEVRKLLAKRSP
jgi:hypothetical protein